MVKQKNEKTVNAQNNKDESYSSDISLKYSARKVVSCPSINFSFNFVERQLFWEFNRRSHNLGARGKAMGAVILGYLTGFRIRFWSLHR